MIRTRPLLAATALTALLSAVLGVPPAFGTDDPGDPALQQRINADQRVVSGRAELARGHVDLGPRYADGTWRLMVHDDTDLKGSVWRPLDDVLFRVSDTALQEVPGDPAYSFLGVPAGTRVHVVPQTQDENVIWLGWNTQEPGVLKGVDRGATLTLEGVDGPGDVLVYLQSGTFGAPQVLWDSRKTAAQDLWVDLNTHTHANWVFTKPGTYLLRVRASADLVDGTAVSDTRTLRLAVGDAVTTRQALAEAYAGPDPQDAAPAAERTEERSGSSPAPWLLGGAALLLATGAVLATVRGRRARRAGSTRGEER